MFFERTQQYADFNPRSRVGSDFKHGGWYWSRIYFNPRSRVGSDREICEIAWAYLNFNPRSRVGSDVERLVNIDTGEEFQSTLPRRERR